MLTLLTCEMTPVRAQQLSLHTVIPPLPGKIEFAGERVPLENYDTRESLQREVSITTYMHSRTLYALLRTRRYFAVIEPILAENNIPNDFKYLCMAESGLNPDAVSPAGAAGLWQIMPAVARSFGMEVNAQIDERYHIEKATRAACRHLKESYAKFRSWTLAAAAYNLGMAGLSTRMEKQGIGNYYDLFLPEETLRYVHRILSMKLLYENPARYGYAFPSEAAYPPFDRYREVSVSARGIDWSAFAREHGTTYKMLRELNPWIRDYTYANPNGKSYTVKIPLPGFRSREYIAAEALEWRE